MDGPENGEPHSLWKVVCRHDQLFVDRQAQIEVPHTATIQVRLSISRMASNKIYHDFGVGIYDYSNTCAVVLLAVSCRTAMHAIWVYYESNTCPSKTLQSHIMV